MEQLEAVLQAGLERGAVPGVSAVVVDRDGIRWQGAVGERTLGGGNPMSTDTVGAIFSMTKAITSTAALQCVEAGLLTLDEPASRVLPSLGDPVVLTGFDDDGRPTTRPAVGEVTLRQLLTHTSGYTYAIWDADILRWYEASGTPGLGSGRKASLQTPLAFDPGTRWDYGTGTDWVGLLVEAATGTTLGDYFEQHVTGPLGMTSTTFHPVGDVADRLAGMHARLPDGSLVVLDRPAPVASEFEGGGGGLFGTADDYGRFVRMILNNGELDGHRLLQADSVEQMCTNNIGNLRVSQLRTVMPNLSNDAELFPGEEKTWGLAFQVHEVPGHTGRPAGTAGWAGLPNSYYWIDRANQIAGVFMTQIMPFADIQALELYYDFERSVYDSL